MSNTLAGRRIPDNHLARAVKGHELYYCLNQIESRATYACVIETEAIEGHLEVQILVQLRHRGVYVLLIVAIAAILILVEVPVHEIAAQLGQTGGGNCIAPRSG